MRLRLHSLSLFDEPTKRSSTDWLCYHVMQVQARLQECDRAGRAAEQAGAAQSLHVLCSTCSCAQQCSNQHISSPHMVDKVSCVRQTVLKPFYVGLTQQCSGHRLSRPC